MWLRSLTLSFLNVILTLFVIVALLAYVVPDSAPSIALRLISWSVAFIVTIICTFWVFHKRVPQKNDAILLVAFHALGFFIVYGSYGTAFLDRGAASLISLDFIVQLGLEIAAILFVAYRLRRGKLQSMLGEGRML